MSEEEKIEKMVSMTILAAKVIELTSNAALRVINEMPIDELAKGVLRGKYTHYLAEELENSLPEEKRAIFRKQVEEDEKKYREENPRN